MQQNGHFNGYLLTRSNHIEANIEINLKMFIFGTDKIIWKICYIFVWHAYIGSRDLPAWNAIAYRIKLDTHADWFSDNRWY